MCAPRGVSAAVADAASVWRMGQTPAVQLITAESGKLF